MRKLLAIASFLGGFFFLASPTIAQASTCVTGGSITSYITTPGPVSVGESVTTDATIGTLKSPDTCRLSEALVQVTYGDGTVDTLSENAVVKAGGHHKAFTDTETVTAGDISSGEMEVTFGVIARSGSLGTFDSHADAVVTAS